MSALALCGDRAYLRHNNHVLRRMILAINACFRTRSCSNVPIARSP